MVLYSLKSSSCGTIPYFLGNKLSCLWQQPYIFLLSSIEDYRKKRINEIFSYESDNPTNLLVNAQEN